MRFAAYEHQHRPRVAVVEEDGTLFPLPGVTSLTTLLTETDGLPGLLAAGAAALDVPAGPHVSQVRLLPPLRPASVRDFVTFEEHVEGVRRAVDGVAGVPEQWYAAPTFYFTNPHAVYGPHDDVPVPPGSAALDFELEVAAVIGREGRDLTPEQARDHIVGYTVFNDWSARDLQSAEMKVGLGPCKGKDTATTLGPYLVTPDELEPHRDADGFLRLALTAEVNGETVGTDLLSHMSWTFEEMTAYASRGTRVVPGDVLGSGTCGNGGCLAELWGLRGTQDPPPLKPGDTVTLTVEGIGSLTSTVVPGAEPVPLPAGRRRGRERP
ncbi:MULTISPECIES: fumarylacetoacetate hydrolase family protein [Streptomyces]|uniref:2-keto-4-pentenoate hydratase/2-oxohepta-3-ene-1,7-dioic acid hydratase in catechol pathway n=1 Tax=Streptomyces clavifer TaxID=68188 RepID=A0ABS4V146_9ACTN|nr:MULTISPECIES: fumarylacetoacetate hydrolase family protein [Streptomyces]KQX92376.1 hydroxylase [Streptomyces sp. Root1319]MBP2357616.1 2-keto-4-pentenoate hydratase/2-oxohepta-3-ene-1,7-dioic acid hydratase in catechol pathway [Streptomyces clavifer]MDX2747161.1 fumarylacetoacetate hydrolase family protein [Streptomyces sp. NRRL_B-2557]MDX3063954.1 fumarylacetoacetate hydrolase family protein [Streptomyces sp. ND04-05B]RPK84869.1 Ureidoglycolate lyase [Streptomyces sp. ADI97-07]